MVFSRVLPRASCPGERPNPLTAQALLLRVRDPTRIGAYHQLWQVEKSFHMSKSDLKARPIYHHKPDSIEAHLTIVFAALAIAR